MTTKSVGKMCLEVLKQKGKSDKGRNLNQRADLNHDREVSLFDVDLITDVADFATSV